MLKILSLCISLLLTATGSFAQNPDSVIVVKTKWQKTKIDRHLSLYRFHFKEKNLFNANENISYLEVKNTAKRLVFAIGAEEKELLTTRDFGIRDSAIAALNGNFFDVKNGGSVDFVKVSGKIINSNRFEKNDERARHQRAAVVINKGKISVRRWDGNVDWEKNLTEENVMLNGPLLTYNQVDELLDTTSFTELRHPRTCLGIKPNGKIILLTVDGRNENSAGMSLPELRKLMKWLGCETVVNFDGGGSTTLWVKNMPDDGVINYPTDNKKWDHYGQRKVANVILVKKK